MRTLIAVSLISVVLLAALAVVPLALLFDALYRRASVRLSRRVAEVERKHEAGVAGNRARLDEVRGLIAAWQNN